ncbi:TPA: IS3 family transposase [Salmonella enterica subsp. enterica serovar Muenchen]
MADYIRHGRQDMADYIRYYNLDRGHTSNSGISPVRYEQLSFKKVSGFA